MTTTVDNLLRSTFTTREVAESALQKSGGDVVKARKAVARRKGAPIDPALGARIARLHGAAKAEGAHRTPNGGPLQLQALDIPRDFSALLFIATHWQLSGVDLAGAALFGPGISTSDPALRASASHAYPFGELRGGARLVLRLGAAGDAQWIAVGPDAQHELFADLDAVLARIEGDAERQIGALAGTRAPGAGPPIPCPGETNRVYAGDERVACELPSVDLYHQRRLLMRPLTRKKLPTDDMWLVSREGQLFKLTLVTKGGGKRADVYGVSPVTTGSPV